MITLEEYKKRHVTVVVDTADNIELVTGPRGERGEKGEQGEPGVSNIPGPQGEQGEQGIQGEPGPAGKDGKDGKDGANGADGLPGADGKDGKDGLPGRDGINGKDGKDGAQGIQGLPGTAGKDGKDGATGSQGVAGPAGVGIKGFASGYVNAGTFVTLDNLKFTVTTGGNRGLSCATVTGTAALSISGTFGYVNGVGGSATTAPVTYTTTPSGSWFGWSFPNAGDGSTYLINDTTNIRFYRVTLMIGPGYNNNFISIERLY